MSIELRKHNEEAYEKIQEEFKNSKKVAVIHPTGTGKSFLALKLIEDNKDKRAMYIAPSNAILHTVKNNILDSGMDMTDFTNLGRITYQKLMKLSDEEIEQLGIDMIILDEFHHCGAPEWGTGIDRLLEKYPDAQVLGLSATPIRHFDYSRDMAKELFEDSIASEMTLEEAINNGILPKAKYVSALYEFEGELGKIQDDIEKIRNPEKKKQAQAMFEKLAKQVNQNTKNLPSILSEHMKEKNGKYIVFCKNIEDMQEKIEQAQSMFGEVNPNIKTYAVSSKLADNQRTLKKFEKDNDENTLKLMFAVDMLNEGYHINDLDGVIMMRPTYSPTIYAQQLGRALTVKDDGSVPLVVDLVNNFDSIKIIEDLYEKLKQYEPTGEHKKEKEQQGGLIIYDTTREFRDIAKKISELSKRKIIPLQEKIETLERYFKEGNYDINGQTIFEGKPIGQWVIQIRSQLKNNNRGINATEEQLEKLNELGILERRIDSTIDEKIDALIEWKKKYPDIKIERKNPEKSISNETYEKLQELAKNEGEDIWDIEYIYEKIQSYNEYVIQRAGKGKLTDEQMLKCKDGNLGGRFGFPTEMEEQANRLGIEPKKVAELREKYESVENFVKMYREGKLRERVIFYNEYLTNNVIDIDCNPLSKNYAKLLHACYNIKFLDKNELLMFSSKKIEEVLENLTPREMKILQMRFGLIDGKSNSWKKIGKYYGFTQEKIKYIEGQALRKLRHPNNIKQIRTIKISSLKESEYITDEERKLLNDLENDIWNSNLIFQHDSLVDIDFNKDKFDVIRNICERINIKEEEKAKEQKMINGTDNDIDIEEFEFSIRTHNCLRRAGINTLNDLMALSKEDIMRIRNLGRKQAEEIFSMLEEKRVKIGETDKDSPVVEETKEQTSDKVYNKSEIEEIKVKKMELEAELKTLEEQAEKAKKLLAEYNKLIGDDKAKTDDEALDFKDE